MRHGSRLDGYSFRGCSRQGMRRVVCRFEAFGETATLRTRCHVRVVVTAPARRPVGRLRKRCTERRKLVLRPGAARRALKEAVERAAGKRVGVELSRVDARTFIGFAEWRRRDPGGEPEQCFAEATARLASPGRIEVDPPTPSCGPAPEPAAG